jgi:hypothetical protein
MVVTCPLCGYRFDPRAVNVCSGCPLDHGCEKTCCPNCHYSWVRSSALARFFSRLFKRRSGFGGS